MEKEERSSAISSIITGVLTVLIAFGIWQANKTSEDEIIEDNEEVVLIIDDIIPEEVSPTTLECYQNYDIKVCVGDNKWIEEVEYLDDDIEKCILLNN